MIQVAQGCRRARDQNAFRLREETMPGKSPSEVPFRRR